MITDNRIALGKIYGGVGCAIKVEIVLGRSATIALNVFDGAGLHG